MDRLDFDINQLGNGTPCLYNPTLSNYFAFNNNCYIFKHHCCNNCLLGLKDHRTTD